MSPTATGDVSKLVVGTAPDSWGVWFPEDARQVSWKQYLDDVARAGYVWTELGPQGFLPQDAAQLSDELSSRGLKVCGGTVFAGMHKGRQALDKAIADFCREAKLLSALGAEYLVHLPEQYTDMHTGKATQSAEIDPEQWSNLVTGTNELGKRIFSRVRRQACVPPPRRHPRGHPGPDPAVPRRTPTRNT